MKKSILIPCLILISTLFATGDSNKLSIFSKDSNGNSGAYTAVALSGAKYSGNSTVTPFTFSAKFKGSSWILGYQFNKYLAIEGRYFRNFGDVSWFNTTNGSFKDSTTLENTAIYIKPIYPIDNLSLYLLLGYGKTTLSLISATTRSDSKLQYGVGMGYNLSNSVSIFGDYVVLHSGTGFDGRDTFDDKYEIFSFGVKYRF